MTNYLRPDEMARESEIRKAQGRTNEVRSGLELVSSVGKAAVGAKAASKILPFLNQYVPEDLAFKGINKVVPGLGDFLKNGMKQGLSLKSGLDFLKQQFASQGSTQAPNQKNIIEQESPELHQFIDQEIRKGRSVLEAGVLAQHDKKFSGVIDKLSKTHKTKWSDILQTVYGTAQQALPQQSANSTQIQQAPTQISPQATQQPGKGQQALTEILQRINQKLGGNP